MNRSDWINIKKGETFPIPRRKEGELRFWVPIKNPTLFRFETGKNELELREKEKEREREMKKQLLLSSTSVHTITNCELTMTRC